MHIRPQWANGAYKKVNGLFERLKILKIGIKVKRKSRHEQLNVLNAMLCNMF